MYVYNVTVNVDDAVAEEWLLWMKRVHIPQVMATGLFTDFNMFRIMDRQEDETGITYAIQYHCPHLGDYRQLPGRVCSCLTGRNKTSVRRESIRFPYFAGKGLSQSDILDH